MAFDHDPFFGPLLTLGMATIAVAGVALIMALHFIKWLDR